MGRTSTECDSGWTYPESEMDIQSPTPAQNWNKMLGKTSTFPTYYSAGNGRKGAELPLDWILCKINHGADL